MIQRKAVIYILLAVSFVFSGKLIFAESEKPKLRWEYKYQEGETLYYYQKVKVTYTEKMQKKLKKEVAPNNPKYQPPETESVEGVLTIKFQKDKDAPEALYIDTELWEKDTNKPTLISTYFRDDRKELTYGIEPRFAVKNDGSIVGNVQYYNVFLMGQPRFVESGLDMWSKTMDIAKSKVTGHYRKLGEEIFKGRKCVVIETEIGQTENVGEYDTSEHLGETEMGGMIIKIKGKTWFDQEMGKIIKMELEKQMINYASGLSVPYWFHRPNYEYSYELLDSSEIKKLDGIEDDWELVLPGVNNFQITADGKIVYVSPIRNDELDSSSISNGVKTTSFIYICDGDGSNQRRLTEGTNPVVSPDGRWVAVNDKDGKLKVLDKETGEENKEKLESIDIVDIRGGGGTSSPKTSEYYFGAA